MSGEVESAFRRLMSRLGSKGSCVTYFGALEKVPLVGKVPNFVEVKVDEILVD